MSTIIGWTITTTAIACWALLITSTSTLSSVTIPAERADRLRTEATRIESSCARDFSINRQVFKQLHSPIKLSVMRNPKENVQCFARCVIDRYGYYMYQRRNFDIERLVEFSTVAGLTENHTRSTADRCMRIAWLGEEDCEDFWNIYKCFHGSV